MKKNLSLGRLWWILADRASLKPRWIGILVLIICCTGSYTCLYGQQPTFSLTLQNTSIRDILKLVEDQSEYTFMYNSSKIDVRRKVNLEVKNSSIENILNRLFNGKQVTYRIIDKRIILTPTANDSVPKEGATTKQPPKRVSGKVQDPSGTPLAGVTVAIQGTTNEVITDAEGHYVLPSVAYDATLVFSFVGLKATMVSVSGMSVIDVTMEEEGINLEEAVAVGYGVQKKASLTGAIGTITADKLTQWPAANTSQLLQGQVSGLVTRQSSGLPGADGTTLNIRGFGEPLVIVDGVYTALSQVDPNDIESISVLKDASAAVYGARAGNGVILVTTKRGANRPSQISYHGSVSINQPTFLADQVTAREWAEMLSESGLNPDNYSPNYVHYNPETKTLENLVDGSVYTGYDWSKALYRNWTPQSQHNLSARGGTEKIRYFVSAGFTDQESNFKSGDYDFNRYNIRSNVDATITEGLSIAVDFSYHSTLLDKANFDVSDVFNLVNSSRPVYPYIHEADPTRAAFSGGARSPYFKTFKDYSGFIEDRGNVLRGTMELNYAFPMIAGLSAKARLTYEDIFSWNKNVSKPFPVWDYDPIAATNGGDPWSQQGIEGLNTISVYSDRINRLLPLFSVQYEKAFGEHHIKGMVANEIWTTKHTTLQGDRKDILSFEAPYLNYASQEGKDNGESLIQTARSSLIGRINYDYLGKYLVEVAMRADASAEYPPEGRWGYFPSISAGWRLSEEPFIKNHFQAINNLKLRASYGILGNDAISSFDYLAGFNITGDYYVFGSAPAPVINSSGLANPYITWETMKMSNIGLDGTLWDGKLGFEIDVFHRLRDNILASPITKVPSTFGAVLPRTNLNKRDNRGIDIALSHANRIGDFTYDISPRFSWTRGKYVDWDENVLPITDGMDAETREFNRLWNIRNVNEGQWDDRQWGYISDGFFMNQQEIDAYPINQDQNGNQTLRVGDIKYKDLNGDHYIDWRDEQVIGKSGLPKIMYSLGLGARYKGISVNMLWQGAGDYTVTFTDRAAAPFHSEGIPLQEHYQYRAITGTDSDGNAYITNPNDFRLPPVTQNGRTANNAKASDFWTYNARFLRLKNLNLNYSLPQTWIAKSGLSQCMIYVSGTNLITISNLGIWKKSFDPEIPVANNRDYPPVKTLTFGLNITI